jgi:hypothetical protein
MALNAFTFFVDPSMPEDGHPQGRIDDDNPFTVHVNSHGSGFLTRSGSNYTFFLYDYATRAFYRLTLPGAQASGFAMLHETGHKTNSFKLTDYDVFAYPSYLNNYANNWKIWNACFPEAKPTVTRIVPRPTATQVIR